MRKILFIKVNPIGTKNLYLDIEENEIADAHKKSLNRDDYQIETKGAVAIEDLHEYLEEFKPNILHISGHGSEEGVLYFHDGENHKKEVSIVKFFEFIQNYNSHLKCIFLNACFSLSGLEALPATKDQTIIGMKDEVPNDTAMLFSRSFYTSIFGGKTIEDSFQSALGVVGIDGFGEEDIPTSVGFGEFDEAPPTGIDGPSLGDLVPKENISLVQTKRRRQKKSYYVIIALVVLISVGAVAYSLFSDQDNLYSLAGILPLGLVKWIKEKLDGIDDSLMLLTMLENEITTFLAGRGGSPVDGHQERVAQINEQFWKIVELK